MLKVILSAFCVLAAAVPLNAAPTAANIAGRWQGDSWAPEKSAPLVLDIVACGHGWCGIRVDENDKCAGTALKIDTGELQADTVQFKGTLELAPGTEPYTVQTSLYREVEDAGAAGPARLHIFGDTGGSFRVFRRSFPFEAQLVRAGDAVCQMPHPVS